jgi:hypothetical protein
MKDQKQTMAFQDPEFRLFPKFPPELRLKIWGMAFISRVPRVVEIRMREEKDSDSANETSVSPYLWSPTPSPALVNSCQEAREVARNVARKTGQLLFDRIFFDPAIDTLYGSMIDVSCAFDYRDFVRELKKHIRLKDVRFLARDLESCGSCQSSPGVHYDSLHFRDLDEYILVRRKNDERVCNNWAMYLGRSRRTLQSLKAQRAWRARRREQQSLPPHDIHPLPSDIKLADLKKGEFTFIDTSEDKRPDQNPTTRPSTPEVAAAYLASL